MAWLSHRDVLRALRASTKMIQDDPRWSKIQEAKSAIQCRAWIHSPLPMQLPAAVLKPHCEQHRVAVCLKPDGKGNLLQKCTKEITSCMETAQLDTTRWAEEWWSVNQEYTYKWLHRIDMNRLFTREGRPKATRYHSSVMLYHTAAKLKRHL